MLVADYIKYHNQYKEKYDKFIILMQKGKFYEIYDVDGNAYKIADLLNFQMTRQNVDPDKADSTRDNTPYCGIPLTTYERHLDRILDEGYTIILIDEIGVKKDGSKKREISQIIRPSTNLDSTKGNNICMIFIEESRNKLYCGISYIDLLTGVSNVIEYGHDSIFENIYEFLDIYTPCEVIVRTKNLKLYNKEYIINFLDLESKNIDYNIKINETKKEFYQNSYHNEVLGKIFTDKINKINNEEETKLISPLEELGLEKYQLSAISYVLLLQFIYECYPEILNKIRKPSINEIDNHLILDYNTITQLNLVNHGRNNNKFNSIFDVLNMCSTVGGRKLLEERLKKPLKTKEEIEERLRIIDELSGEENKEKFGLVKEKIKNVSNINKQVRKLIIGDINKYELSRFFVNISTFLQIYPTHILNYELDTNKINKINAIIEEYNRIFTNYQINDGIYTDLDKLRNDFNKIMAEMYNIINNLAKEINDDAHNFKLVNNDKEGYHFIITKTRANKIKKINKNDDVDIRVLTGNAKIYIKKYADKLFLIEDKINKLEKEKYNSYINELINYKDNLDYFEKIRDYLNEVDYYCSCVSVAQKYNYCRPKVNDKSYIKAKNLRHCLVERLCDTAYVPNDVNMKNGLLLYGLNSAGKTTYARAVAISLIMAQCGMYVPALEYEFGVFSRVMTRITGNDNLFKGQGTFAVEMAELKGIIKKADKNTLVIGDEICKGTDGESGGGIVAASIVHLCNGGVPFIFATHLHNIMKLSEIKDIIGKKELNVGHMEVIRKSDKLVYNRVLKEGQGDTQYGIEVAKAMGLDKDIIKMSLKLRRKLNEEKEHIVEPKRSRYNKDKFMDECEVCGGKAEATHHKSFQCNAVDGFIGEKNKEHISIHDKSNLLSVCNTCHIAIHN